MKAISLARHNICDVSSVVGSECFTFVPGSHAVMATWPPESSTCVFARVEIFAHVVKAAEIFCVPVLVEPTMFMATQNLPSPFLSLARYAV